MYFLNQSISNHNIYNYVDASVNVLIQQSYNITVDKKYWLFFFIKDNFRANIQYVSSINIDNDIFGFIPVWRNIRHSIEAFYDLYNLVHDEEYLSVIGYASKQGRYNNKYGKFIYNKMFTIQSKQRIATECYGWKEYSLLTEVASESNKYIHPNVFINVFQINQIAEKEALLRKLLMANVYLLTEAYQIVLQGYNQRSQPALACLNCFTRNCYSCYQNLYQDYIRWINGQLFVFVNPNPNPYTFHI